MVGDRVLISPRHSTTAIHISPAHVFCFRYISRYIMPYLCRITVEHLRDVLSMPSLAAAVEASELAASDTTLFPKRLASFSCQGSDVVGHECPWSSLTRRVSPALAAPLRKCFVLLPSEAHTTVPTFAIPFSLCCASKLLASLVENIGDDAGDDDDRSSSVVPVAVQGIHSDVLGIVAAYIVHFSEPSIAGPLLRTPVKLQAPFPQNTAIDTVGSDFEQEILQQCLVDTSFCLGVMHAANFLGVMPLVYLSGLAIALRLRGRSPRDFRDVFATAKIPMAVL
jgi:hypothetical protein